MVTRCIKNWDKITRSALISGTDTTSQSISPKNTIRLSAQKINISNVTNAMESRATVRLEESLTSLPKQLQCQIRKITEKCVYAYNVSNGRLKDSNCDVTCTDFVSHYFTWLEVNKNVHNESLLDQHNRNVPWCELKAMNEDTTNVLFVMSSKIEGTNQEP